MTLSMGSSCATERSFSIAAASPGSRPSGCRQPKSSSQFITLKLNPPDSGLWTPNSRLGIMWALLWKDIRLEFRTKERVSSLFVLALLIVLVFVFALSPEHAQGPQIAAALLWVTLLF